MSFKVHNDAKTFCLELRQLVDQALPVERAEVLEFTLDLLHFIAKKSDLNKMTSKNLATVFLPALFFSVQSDSTSPEEIMKMAVLGKSVSQTLSFMIDNPTMDPAALEHAAKSSSSSITIPVGASLSASNLSGKLSRSDSVSNTKSHPNSPVSTLKKGTRRRSSTLPENQVRRRKEEFLLSHNKKKKVFSCYRRSSERGNCVGCNAQDARSTGAARGNVHVRRRLLFCGTTRLDEREQTALLVRHCE